MSESRRSYDYVIVGAGSAGCVLAARLSENPDVTVALLEAGGSDRQAEIQTPIAFPAVFKSSIDWDLLGEPEPGLDNRRLYLPRGRVIGGCGSINAMIYARGNRADYDGWAAGGAEGWAYQDVLPYFRRSEDNERGEDAYHGVGGPLSISDSRSMHPLVDAMIEAATQAGHERNPDFNGARQEGAGRFQFNQRDGLRWSTADAFLHPARERANLDVVTHALSTRILFEGDRAAGVEIVRDDEVIEIRAQREVILSAGAYQSPVLLMLSGIGPADHLAALGIEVRTDLPVGDNLQDHCMANLNYLTSEPGLFGALTPENFEMLAQGRGPLTSNGPEGAAFIRTRANLDGPDVQFHFSPSLFFDEGLTAPHDHGVAFGPVVIKPTSRGFVRLRTPRPDSKPVVLCNFLTTEEDRASMLAGARLAMEVAAQPALASVIRERWSAPESDSDADIMAWVRRASQTVYHATSTCSIGAVVDSSLRVQGTEALRVADASVMPTITRGNTHAATIMIAEKAADLIREGA
ncbi:MAG TPA: GMC family oxidoreductase N-terminal domain-containing protein [Solirubrobacteraceae bacterium]|nr:GMC family oxidoreductase N-terminal domain-containing protein [Solirubrobacteraceae bacterium]